VENLNSPVLADRTETATVMDVRQVPLAQLSVDRDAKRMADRILADAARPSLIAAVGFNSAI
jgi:hypothetical protein